MSIDHSYTIQCCLLYHLYQVKAKLEQTIDELEDSLERESRSKLEQEKQRKKVENELRKVQEDVNIAERSKSDLDSIICRNKKEIFALTTKLETEQELVAKGLKQITECGVNINI